MAWVRPVKHVSQLFRLSLMTLILVYLQLIIGAWMRHSGAGLAVLDFPRMGGWILPSWDREFLMSVNEMRAALALPAVTWGQVFIHLAHRFSGFIVACAVLIVAMRTYSNASAVPKLRRPAVYVSLLVIAQLLLGIFTVLSVRQPLITSMHVWMGALLLGVCTLLVARLQRIRMLRRKA